MTFVEDTLQSNAVCINMITRRFSMLPQSIKRYQETDEKYRKTRRRILNSATTKELFDNLTELKHWSYMTPDILAHIVQDVKIDDIHRKIDVYRDKLTSFKTSTKLRDLIDVSFPVPDYCIELTIKAEGWEEKTIEEAEKIVMNIIYKAAYRRQDIQLGLKRADPGCIELTFVLMEFVKIHSEKLPSCCKDTGAANIQVDGETVYSKCHIKPEVKLRIIIITV